MTSEKKLCTSCNTSISNDIAAVEFKCPKCQKSEIKRCGKCRKIAAHYKCAACGFRGPH